MSDYIYGRNTVLEALRSQRSINKIFVQKGQSIGSIREILAVAREQKVLIEEVDSARLSIILPNTKHQGVVAAVSPVDYYDLDDVLAIANTRGEAPFLILLNELQDPQNVGAILRTANIAGAHGVLLTKRRSCPLTGVVAKVSAGAVEHTPVVQIGNVAQTLDYLKKQGLWVVGADMEGKEYFAENMQGPIVLVIGSEAEGLGRLVKDKCDILVKIPMFGQITSLNASVACGILAFDIVRQRIVGGNAP